MQTYLETQTEAIVHSIKELLSAIRSGAPPGQLSSNLTEIISIVSSIVAVSRDNLPPGEDARAHGQSILRDLTENCDRLTEMQVDAGQVFSKQAKQAIASASFGVAKVRGLLGAPLIGAGVEGASCSVRTA